MFEYMLWSLKFLLVMILANIVIWIIEKIISIVDCVINGWRPVKNADVPDEALRLLWKRQNTKCIVGDYEYRITWLPSEDPQLGNYEIHRRLVKGR